MLSQNGRNQSKRVQPHQTGRSVKMSRKSKTRFVGELMNVSNHDEGIKTKSKYETRITGLNCIRAISSNRVKLKAKG